MTGLVSVDREDYYVVQLKTQRQKTHCKNNQLSDCATINLIVVWPMEFPLKYL